MAKLGIALRERTALGNDMTQLSGESAKKRFITNGKDAGVRKASYDLHVGKVILQGVVRSDNTTVHPQQTFVIVSQEMVKVPGGIVGYAMPKTSLCNQGILVLNTGLIDPDYDGPMSTTAINFDKDAREIRIGDPFLRLVFHRLDVGAGPSMSNRTPEQYLEERRADSERYPSTFLDVPNQIERLTTVITDKVVEGERNLLLAGLTRVNVTYALWSIGVATVIGISAAIAAAVMSRPSASTPPIVVAPPANTPPADAAMLREFDRIESRLQAIEQRIPRVK